ncbi:MAG: hypothetical protein ACKPKO_19940, partial [Candidatus Fonsibacter sp.]
LNELLLRLDGPPPKKESAVVRGESASSSSGPQTDAIRFRVHNGALKKEMNLVAPITVEDLIMYIVADPKPFHGNITKERARSLTMDNVELPLSHEFENDFYKLHTLTLLLAGPPPKKESAVVRGESASSSSGPQTDTIHFRVHNGAMKKEMNLVAPITVEDLIMYLVANPKPFHGNITKERVRILTMDNVELPLSHEFENDFYKLNELLLRLDGPPPKKE